ncbi:MAG: UDP-N-acetylglucosamine--N-acetylmuramyl-(pentapeptide) pyrophosphoryl-undecaprenol N-acetylglucosamine transferase [Actinomycetia bacterium]|nr:UDP-N-acetylglucosamine--N-acetylmuramyl-(pentapeptide) pyrophosphoryl-undecaprenol N-acetylglucosamine transferase [Actinomycetes bacterium]MCP4962625.1 UDP-N-acetylglucosamine--N-acetylmuramyl-(pentapeptide) pyrophosphoryl-undecaprenol N-acetylglucosamine transferase [Actinomycetes bacterium]
MNKRVLIAGGGTGGHVVPGLAVARALVAGGLGPAELHWVGSERGMEVEAVPAAGFSLTVLPGRGIERSLSLANFANVLGIVRGVFKGITLVRRLSPEVVVSLGGYAAVPAIVGAIVTRTPIVIQEQNATPSLANRLASRFSVASSVPVEGVGLRHEVVTGNPIDDQMSDAADRAGRDGERELAAARLGLPETKTIIAAFGGSLGARRINHAVLDLADRWSDRDDVAIHHVIGRRDWADLAERVDRLQSTTLHYQAVEFEDRMPDLIVAADMAISRAGGMAVAELSAVGLPALLVPLPIAPNDAQRANAAAVVAAGGALLIDDSSLDADLLEAELEPLVGPKGAKTREIMASATLALGRPDAAEKIAAIVMEVADADR